MLAVLAAEGYAGMQLQLVENVYQEVVERY
jgi:hypothetical protein